MVCKIIASWLDKFDSCTRYMGILLHFPPRCPICKAPPRRTLGSQSTGLVIYTCGRGHKWKKTFTNLTKLNELP
jgi:transposase-like protein